MLFTDQCSDGLVLFARRAICVILCLVEIREASFVDDIRAPCLLYEPASNKISCPGPKETLRRGIAADSAACTKVILERANQVAPARRASFSNE